MCGIEDSSIALITNSNNSLRNNEICHLNTKLLSQINLKCTIDEDSTLPLIFFGRRDQIDIIRCDTGQKISSLKASNTKFIKWFLPSQHLRIFGDHHNDQQFGIITVDSSNVLRFYPELFDPIEFKTNIVGTHTIYYRDLNGRIKLAVLVVESNGNVTRWIPFENDSIKAKNLINKEVKLISDNNLILELNNLAELGTFDSGENFGKFDSNWAEKYLNLNKKLFLATNDQVCIVDSTSLELLGSIGLKPPITSIFPFIAENESLLVVNNAINILNLGDFRCVYKYGHNIDELSDHESVRASDVLCARVELTNPDLLLLSTKYSRLMLLNTRNGTLTSYLSVSTSRLYLYYYLAPGTRQAALGLSDATKAENGLDNENEESALNGLSTAVQYGLIGADDGCLVALDLFQSRLLFNKLAISGNIDVLANSQLIPNALLAASGARLAQLDLHLAAAAAHSSDRPAPGGPPPEFRGVSVDRLRSPDKNSSRILGNNLGGLRWLRLPGGGARVTAAAFHPRLPNVCALGRSDGSLHFLFVEHENPELFHLSLVRRFERPVRRLAWHLIPKGLSPSGPLFDAASAASAEPNPRRWPRKSHFLERIYKSIDSSRYVSVALVQLACRSGDPASLFLVDLGDGSVHDLREGCADCCNYSAQTPQHSLQAHSTHTAKTDPQPSMFSAFVLQYPPPGCPGEADEPTVHPPGAYNNFSVICDHVCLAHCSEGALTLSLLLIELDLSVRVVKRFRMAVKGAVTSVCVTSKQYNQYHLFADQYLRKTGCTDSDSDASDTPHLDPPRFDRCLNSMQQYLLVSTNLGYVYVTSLLKLYNNFLAVSGSNSNSNTGFSPENDPFSQPEPLVMDEIFIASANILHLDHTILYSPNYSNLTQLPNVSPSTDSKDQLLIDNHCNNCLCSSSCYFIIVVGLNDLILFYTLDVDHSANKFKLVLFYSKKVNYSSFTLINEPFHYFKLLVNSSTCLHQYYFHYSQIHSFMAKFHPKD